MSGFECFNTHDSRNANGYWLTRLNGVWSAKKSRGQYSVEGPEEIPMTDTDLRKDMADRLRYYQKRVDLLIEALNAAEGEDWLKKRGQWIEPPNKKE